MKSKVAERIMARTQPNTALQVEFTVMIKRHGFMKWLEDKEFIQPHMERMTIFYNKMNKPTFITTTSRKRPKTTIDGEIEIRHNNIIFSR